MFARFVIPILLVASGIALFFVAVIPGYERIQVVEAEIEELNAALETTEEVTGIVNDLSATVATISAEDRRRLEGIIPRDRDLDIVEYATNLTTLALRRGLQLTTLTYRRDTLGKTAFKSDYAKKIGQYHITFKVTTSYEEFQLLLADIENTEHLMDIHVTKFSVGKEDDLYNYNVNLYTYYIDDNF